jgi:hypothetical protein
MINNIGQNSINKTLEDFIITGTGRIIITDQIVRDYLKPTIQNSILKDKIIYDSKVIGLWCRVSTEG